MASDVLISVQWFTSYAITVVTLMIIYYIIKFFMVAPPTKEQREANKADREAKAKKWRDWVGGSIKESQTKSKTKAEKQKKKDLVSKPKQYVRKSIEACDEAIRYLDKKDITKFHKSIKYFNGELKGLWGYLKIMRTRVPKEWKSIGDLITEIEVISKDLNDKSKIPKEAKMKKSDIPNTRDEIIRLRGLCGDIFEKLEKYHK